MLFFSPVKLALNQPGKMRDGVNYFMGILISGVNIDMDCAQGDLTKTQSGNQTAVMNI